MILLCLTREREILMREPSYLYIQYLNVEMWDAGMQDAE